MANIPGRANHNKRPTRPHLKLETGVWKEGIQFIAGVDEAGRGAWAGPVAAAAVLCCSAARFCLVCCRAAALPLASSCWAFGVPHPLK